jgi:hypothetical protein
MCRRGCRSRRRRCSWVLLALSSSHFPLSLNTVHKYRQLGNRQDEGGGRGDLLLHTSSTMQLRRITERRLHAQRRLASKVIIAVPRLSDEPGAADDDVRLERVASAVDGVGDVAGPFASFWVAGRGLV